MAKLSTGIHKAISLHLRTMYDGFIAEGVPDRLAAILSAPDGDPAVLSAHALAR